MKTLIIFLITTFALFGQVSLDSARAKYVGDAVTEIRDPDEKVSIRFTNQHSGVLSNVTLNFISGVEREIKIGIQEDDGS